MALWTFTEMSEMLNCSPQNIYQKKAKLKNMGCIEIDPEDNKEKINENGYNYLLTLRKITMQNNSNNLNNNTLNAVENIENTTISTFKQDFVFEFMENQIKELKERLKEVEEEKKHWQDLYIQQSEDFKKIAFPPMLDTADGNKQTAEKVKKGFFARLFS